MMTSEIRRKPPQTYADLKANNYTLYVVDDGRDAIHHVGLMIGKNNRWKFVEN